MDSSWLLPPILLALALWPSVKDWRRSAGKRNARRSFDAAVDYASAELLDDNTARWEHGGAQVELSLLSNEYAAGDEGDTSALPGRTVVPEGNLLVVSVPVSLPVDVEIKPVGTWRASGGRQTTGDQVFDAAVVLTGPPAELLARLPWASRAYVTEALKRRSVEISGGSVHVEPSRAGLNGIQAAVEVAVGIAKVLNGAEGTDADRLSAIACDPAEPRQVRLTAARLLTSSTVHAGQRHYRQVIDGGDLEACLRVARLMAPVPLGFLLGVVTDGNRSAASRLEALEVLASQPLQDADVVDALAGLVEAANGRLLIGLLGVLTQLEHPIPLDRLRLQFRAVGLEARAALLRAAVVHGGQAESWCFEVLSQARLTALHAACCEVLGEVSSVRLVERLLTLPQSMLVVGLIASLQAGVSATAGGLTVLEEVETGGAGALSEVEREAAGALSEVPA